jgi:translocation and assembly module TamA
MRCGTRLISLLLGLAVTSAEALTLDVQIDGLEGRELAAVRSALDLEQEKETPDLLASRVRRLYERGSEQVLAALEPFGLYRARVAAELREDGEAWVARFVVDPGEPVRIASLSVHLSGAGEDDPVLRRVLDGLPLRLGEPLEHGAYESAKRSLQQAAADRGYLRADLTRHTVEVDLEQYAARVTLALDTGPRYRFGGVTFDQDVLDPTFLARYAPFSPGDPYSRAELLELQTGLADSEYFASVEVTPQVPEAGDGAEDGEVPIEVRATARPRHRYRFGLGYGTDTGPRARLGWEDRRVNRWGHRAGVEGRASERINDLRAYYLVPLARPATEALRFEVRGEEEDTVSFRTRVASIGVGRSVVRKDWRETIKLSYEYEDYTVGRDSGTSELLMPEARWVSIDSDDELRPLAGWRFGLDLRGAVRGPLADSTFLRTRGQAKMVRGVGEDGRALVRADAGFTLAESVADLPVSQRFFAGGDQSVRGYALDSIGPEDAAGKVTGGRYLLVGSVEYEHRVAGNWSLAAFYDVGNAFEPHQLQVKQGAGLGLRWLSPVGPVRLDVASALDEPGNPLRLHVVIGPDL